MEGPLIFRRGLISQTPSQSSSWNISPFLITSVSPPCVRNGDQSRLSTAFVILLILLPWDPIPARGSSDTSSVSFDCYSPLEKKLHRIRFPTTPNLPRSTICLASARGWLLMLEDDTNFLDPLDDKPTLPISIRPFLFNPLTLAVIPLLMLSIIPGNKSFGAVSSPPVDPDCTILLISGGSVFLCRLNDPGDGWTMGLEIKESIVSIVYCGGKFYCMSRKGVLFVIDRACPTPTRLCLTIDASALDLRDGDMCRLVEFGGELLLVMGLKDWHFPLKGFEVFTADLSENKWAKKMDMLADHVLFLDERCSLSLLASDVGCKKNCIYYTHTHGPYILSAFDLDARDWIHSAF